MWIMMLDVLDYLLNKHVEIIMSMDFIVNHVVQYLCMYGLFHMQGMNYLLLCYCTGCLAYFWANYSYHVVLFILPHVKG